METRRGSLPYYLGWKAPCDPLKERPNIENVRSTIKYAIETGRLDKEVEHTATQTSQVWLALRLPLFSLCVSLTPYSTNLPHTLAV
jgi:hypothetical protein